jgi:hypothetical protein
MVEFIREFAIDLVKRMRALESEGIMDRGVELLEQLNRLDPREFVPEQRCRFLEARLRLRRWVGQHVEESRAQAVLEISPGGYSWSQRGTRQEQWANTSARVHLFESAGHLVKREDAERAKGEIDEAIHTVQGIVEVLDYYEGLGGIPSPRSFSFIHDDRLRELVCRDYRELHLKLFQSRAWKSVVALSGSILEAVLWDQLAVDETKARRVAATLPRLEGSEVGRGQPLKDWFLAELIEVACSPEIGLLPAETKNLIHRSLRKHRNLIHPRQEIKKQLECTEAIAGLAKNALDHICDHLAQSVEGHAKAATLST